ncbi:peptide ABC transporter substrate-binding protein [Rhizobium pusense]|uniref:peptide ABC transporter substrate-binding protein n=1 Tax=Agrobacterium pusense TaxID=648995 RepID=UPI001FDC2110|nr:peptide ABC transporter substrate-binding protein [Agrobacterium pusense]
MTHDNETKLNMSRRRLLQTAGALGATMLAAPNLLGKPAFAQGADSAPTGKIVVGLSQEPTVFNPLMAKIEVDDGVHFSLFDALFRATPEGVIVPSLAAEVPSQANGGISADGLEWRIKLRDDVKWHDGNPFTAEDVKFTLELTVDPNFKSWRTLGHSLLRDITIVSPTELTWRMEKPFSPYLALLTETFIVPKHVLEPEADRNAAPFNQAPIGTGAFKWGNRVAGDHLSLVANTEYFGEGPFIEELIFKYIPDITVLYTQFKSGDIDVVGRQYISADNYEEAKTLPDRVVSVAAGASVEGVYFNMGKPQFQDAAVREAIYAAIDKQIIIEQVYYGVPIATESVLPPSSFYYNPDLPKHEFNLDRAKEILDQAGWVPGSDGIRAKDGVRLSFNNSTTSGNHLREQTQQFIQQTLAEVGIEMKISNMPAAVIWGEFWMMSQFESVLVGSNYTVSSDPDVTNRFHSKSSNALGGSGSNNAQYNSPKVDALLDEGARTFDTEARKKIYDEVQSVIRADLPVLPLFIATEVRGHKKNIEGVVPNGNTRTESWNATTWKLV